MSYQQCTRFRTSLDFDRKYLWNDQAIDKPKTALATTNLINFGPLTKKMTLTFDLWPWNAIGFVGLSRYMFVQYHQAEYSGSWAIVLSNFLALSRNGKESENVVLWPWPLTYNLEILRILSGSQCACLCKISSSYVQRFTSYRANREKVNSGQWKMV